MVGYDFYQPPKKSTRKFLTPQKVPSHEFQTQKRSWHLPVTDIPEHPTSPWVESHNSQVHHSCITWYVLCGHLDPICNLYHADQAQYKGHISCLWLQTQRLTSFCFISYRALMPLGLNTMVTLVCMSCLLARLFQSPFLWESSPTLSLLGHSFGA